MLIEKACPRLMCGKGVEAADAISIHDLWTEIAENAPQGGLRASTNAGVSGSKTGFKAAKRLANGLLGADWGSWGKWQTIVWYSSGVCGSRGRVWRVVIHSLGNIKAQNDRGND